MSGEEVLDGLPLVTFELAIAGRAWRIRAARNHDALLEAAEGLSVFPYGLLLWESAPVLAEFLAGQQVAGLRMLELGAGAGLAGIVAAHLGAHVRQTDHSTEALALCRANAAANGVAGVEVAAGDWNDWRDETRYDLIAWSDVLYDRAAFKPLLSIIEQNLASGGRVVLTDPGRGDTPMFLSVARLSGWRVETQRIMAPALIPANGRTSVPIDVITLQR